MSMFSSDVIKRIDRYLEKDEFLNLICSVKNKYATAEDLLAEMDKSGVEMAAISGFAAESGPLPGDERLRAGCGFPNPRRLLPMAVVFAGSVEEKLNAAAIWELSG